MSAFLLSLEITKEIEKALTKFWWNTTQTGRNKIHWLSWERLSKHKSSRGLGFRNFHDFNLAMLRNQGWRFLSKPECLITKVYKAKYSANCDFLEFKLGHNPSFVWHNIWEAKDVVSAGVNGELIRDKKLTSLGNRGW